MTTTETVKLFLYIALVPVSLFGVFFFRKDTHTGTIVKFLLINYPLPLILGCILHITGAYYILPHIKYIAGAQCISSIFQYLSMDDDLFQCIFSPSLAMTIFYLICNRIKLLRKIDIFSLPVPLYFFGPLFSMTTLMLFVFLGAYYE